MNTLTRQKHKAIVEYFNDMYNVRRKRMDDAIAETAKKFFISEKYAYKVIFYIKDNYEYYTQLSEQGSLQVAI